jgi:GT2 family glycosyltransferase
MKDLVVSIGTIDRFDQLSVCLDSIFSDPELDLDYQVVVVINGSPDTDFAERIGARFPAVEVVRSEEKLGYCLTHNRVLGRNDSRYVLVLDDDTVVAKGTLAAMVGYMDSHPDVGIAGCKTLNVDGTLQKSFGLMPTLWTEMLNAVKLGSAWPDRLYRDPEQAKEVEWLNGSFMLVRGEVLRTVGALDERYYTYVCEPDWCHRIRKAGWRVMYVPSGHIVHACGEHSIYTRTRRYGDLVRAHVNKYYFFRKHRGRLANALLRPIMVVGALVRIGYFGALGVARPAWRTETTTRVRAFWRVVRLSLGRRPFEMPGELKTSVEKSSVRG